MEVEQSEVHNGLNLRINELLNKIESNEPVMFSRKTGKGKTKELDLSIYIDSINLEGNELIFGCSITSNGTVRVDELIELAGLDHSKLAGPVIRRSVQWKTK
jgi:hypothetical protein